MRSPESQADLAPLGEQRAYAHRLSIDDRLALAAASSALAGLFLLGIVGP